MTGGASTMVMKPTEGASVSRSRPLSYFDNIRLSVNETAVQTKENSKVIRINNSNIRLGHVLSMSTNSKGGPRASPFKAVNAAASFLAIHHFNERNDRVVPGLSDRLKHCDLYLTQSATITEISQRAAVGVLLDSIRGQHSLNNPHPMAILGPGTSDFASTLSILGGVYEIPQISCCAGTRSLLDVDKGPLFSKAMPTDKDRAKVEALYFSHIGASHVGMVYAEITNYVEFAAEFKTAALDMGIQITSTSFPDTDGLDNYKQGLKRAMEEMAESGLKYFFAMIIRRHVRDFMIMANDCGIVGDGYTWIFSRGMAGLETVFDADVDGKFVPLLQGIGILEIDAPINPDFREAFHEFLDDPDLVEYYKAVQFDRQTLDGVQLQPGFLSSLGMIIYDASMAMAIAACETQTDLFDAKELHETLLQTEFQGATGMVRFNNETGARSADDIPYMLTNIKALGNPQPDGTIHVIREVSAKISLKGDGTVDIVQPFVYADKTTNPPAFLPPLGEDMNPITKGVKITGLVFGAVAMVLSIGLFLWTVKYRHTDGLRASQPFFLLMLSLGTFVMASSVIPMSFQEPMSQNVLDIACNAGPWLFSIGFATSFSALFSKLWRVNKLFDSARAFRRVITKPKDVLPPFLVLMILNISLLTAWSIVSPMHWQRTSLTSEFDRYGRPIESVGECTSDDNLHLWFIGSLAFVDGSAVVFANYEGYLARNLPHEFSESSNIAFAMASLLEAVALGVPLLILGRGSPNAYFFVRALLVLVICLTLLIPIFGPAISNKENGGVEQQRGALVVSGNASSRSFERNGSNRSHFPRHNNIAR